MKRLLSNLNKRPVSDYLPVRTRQSFLSSKNIRLSLNIMVRDEKLKPIHPGEILREELLTPLNISGEKLAQELKVEENIITEIIAEKRNITPEIALRLSCYFPQSAQF